MCPVKTLANPRDKDEIVQRLGMIGPDSQRRWGVMTAAEMICHLSDAFLVGMGERAVKDAKAPTSRPVFKGIVLWFPMPWPHGVPTVPESDARRDGTRPTEIDTDMARLLAVMDRFTRQPRSFPLQPHPIFGRMTEADWMRWGYRHTDHHLKQFGA